MKTKRDEFDGVGCVVSLIFLPINMFLWGWVTLTFYGWFVLPVFPTLPAITLIQMIGLRWFVGVVTAEMPQRKDDELSYSATEKSIMSSMFALAIFFLGWLLKITLM